jgi:hypothetical protein
MTAGSGIMAASQESVMVRRPFTIGRVSFCLLPLLALALWIMALSSLATAGRFSIAGDKQSYQFNVTRALGREPSGTAEVEVALVDRGGGAAPANAALSIGRAEIVAR